VVAARFDSLLVSGFSVLSCLAARTYHDASPIPARAVGPEGAMLFTRRDVTAGQQVFLRHGLMENGSLGRGAYLGPDFSAEYLPTMAPGVRAWAFGINGPRLPRFGFERS
jgi:nitric oxide reductase subunit B